MAATSMSGTQTGAIEPMMEPIPEGWFAMGCETGRDDEKPVHRVWVAEFELQCTRRRTWSTRASLRQRMALHLRIGMMRISMIRTCRLLPCLGRRQRTTASG